MNSIQNVETACDMKQFSQQTLVHTLNYPHCNLIAVNKDYFNYKTTVLPSKLLQTRVFVMLIHL